MRATAVWVHDHHDRTALSVHTDPARAAAVVASYAAAQTDPGVTYYTAPVVLEIGPLDSLRDCPTCPAQGGEVCYSPATGEPCETHRGRR